MFDSLIRRRDMCIPWIRLPNRGLPRWTLPVLGIITITISATAIGQDRDDRVRSDVHGALAYLQNSVEDFSEDPAVWGNEEQRFSTAVAILRAIDTAHSRGLGLISDQPLEAQLSAILTTEFRALIENMPERTNYDMARKLTAGLIMGDSVGSLRRDLLEAQHEDGSWGVEAGRAGNPLDTAVVMNALLGVRQIDVSTETCLAAAAFLSDHMVEGRNPSKFNEINGNPNSNYGPMWPLSGENDGDSHLEIGAIGLEALRLIEGRISDNTTRSTRNTAMAYVETAADGSADQNTIEENAIVFIGLHGLAMYGDSTHVIDAILDSTKKVSSPGLGPDERDTVSWESEDDQEPNAYTTAIAVRGLSLWLPEAEVGRPDLSPLSLDLVIDPTTNEFTTLYRNLGEAPAIAPSTTSDTSVSFVAGQVDIEGVASPQLVTEATFIPEASFVPSEDPPFNMTALGAGDNPIAVTMRLDPEGVIAETNESNNTKTFPIARNSLGLDLSVSDEDIWFEDNGGVWKVRATVRAAGRDILTTDAVTVTLESQTMGGGYSLVSITPTNPAITDRLILFEWTLTNAPTQDTDYRVTASSAAESPNNIGNNTGVRTADISQVSANENISIDSVTLAASPHAPGDNLVLEITGNRTGSSTNPLTPTIEFTHHSTAIHSEIVTVSTSSTWTANITIPDTQVPLPDTAYSDLSTAINRIHLRIVIDSLSEIAETNEADNAYDFVVTYELPDPELEFASLSVSNLDLARRQETDVSIGLRNAGTGTIDFSVYNADIVFHYKYDGLDDEGMPAVFEGDFSRQTISSGTLGLDEGMHLSALFEPPAGPVEITATIDFLGNDPNNQRPEPDEVTTDNNSVTKIFNFTRETLTIELRPDSVLPNSGYSASQYLVQSFGGVIVDLYHRPATTNVLDPFDDAAVTYSAELSRSNSNPSDLIALRRLAGAPNSFLIPIDIIETWESGAYTVYAHGYEDNRLASSADVSFRIEDYETQNVSAVALPATGDYSLPANYDASDLSINDDMDRVPALFVTLSSTANTNRILNYSIVLEKHDPVTNVYSEFPDFSSSDSRNVITGSFDTIPAGSVNKRIDIVIPDDPSPDPDELLNSVFEYNLVPGLYRFFVTVTDTTSTVLAQDGAPFRVGNPDGYILLDKEFKVDGAPVVALKPIEGQEVEVTLTVTRKD